ncbi:hypothetical protein GQ53DRAFT_837232 [Thozetella sp. PMI_491]|nr:hypothetical protein GQ53DRAFT_837232 [Thozetella sp. PMI_491]
MYFTKRPRTLLGLLCLTLALSKCSETSSGSTALDRDIERVESVREIKDVQRSFAHLAQFGRWDDLGKLFAEDGILHWGTGAPLDDKQADVMTGPNAIAAWFRKDAGRMDGAHTGSLHTILVDQPVVTLSQDGFSAKGRWHTLRLMGDGAGATRIQGGEYENEYTLSEKEQRWKISLLRYYPLFAGDYKSGWQNVGTGNRTLPIVPYHFSPDDAGIPIPQGSSDQAATAATDAALSGLEYRVSQLNEEDEVRNLQHSYGYYVDQRMWPNVAELFTLNGTLRIDGVAYTGPAAIKGGLVKVMGPEGLTTGILNEHIIFDTIVEVGNDGIEATARGIELGLTGDANKHAAAWEFGVFYNHFVKDADSGTWKVQEMNITRQMVAKYAEGWGNGGTLSPESSIEPPSFLNIARRGSRAQPPAGRVPIWPSSLNSTGERSGDLFRRLARSAAFDETENISGAYGYFADDIRCDKFGALHAQKGFKESPGTGWYFSQKRITQACLARYNTVDPNPKRTRIPFHWRPQPVIHVSRDGRSASFRSHNIQLGTANQLGDSFNGVKGGGMYHDQMVLEDFGNGTTRRKLWCLTIDEFYWQAATWAGGWSDTSTRGGRSVLATRQRGGGGGGLGDYPPDVSLKEPKMGEREVGFNGGSGKTVSWPNIQRMWFAYRNPVSGRVPDSYWAAPACVPCKGAKPEWALTANGYQEPPTGPTLLVAAITGNVVSVNITGGPDEPVTGTVELWAAAGPDAAKGATSVIASASVSKGIATLTPPQSVLAAGTKKMWVMYLGSDYLSPARTTIMVT